jgi:chromate reductase
MTHAVSRVLGIAGSLRRGSHNRALLETAAELAPNDMKVEIADLNDIPLFNADDEAARGFPPAVVALRDAMAEADALLIATPEYNYSVPGVLKNALDWASRGGASSPLNGIPTAILGAGGRFGTVRAQLHLREILLHNQVPLVAAPQVMVDGASRKFDARGQLTDERHRDQISRLLGSLRELIDRQRHWSPAPH